MCEHCIGCTHVHPSRKYDLFTAEQGQHGCNAGSGTTRGIGYGFCANVFGMENLTLTYGTCWCQKIVCSR
jgi:hypothetical protein